MHLNWHLIEQSSESFVRHLTAASHVQQDLMQHLRQTESIFFKKKKNTVSLKHLHSEMQIVMFENKSYATFHLLIAHYVIVSLSFQLSKITIV